MKPCAVEGTFVQKSVKIISYADKFAVVAKDSRRLEEMI